MNAFAVLVPTRAVIGRFLTNESENFHRHARLQREEIPPQTLQLRINAMNPELLFSLRMSTNAVGIFKTLFLGVPYLVLRIFRDCLFRRSQMQSALPESGFMGCQLSGTKTGLRVLFTPSDNNAGSGAFRSMVELARQLRDRHGVEP